MYNRIRFEHKFLKQEEAFTERERTTTNNGASSILYKEKDVLIKMHKHEWKLKE